jgi:hypothetical protein
MKLPCTVEIELEKRLLSETVAHGCQNLADRGIHVSVDVTTVREAAQRWADIVQAAENGQLTAIAGEEGTLVGIPAHTLIAMAASLPPPRRVGDILREHPGVKASRVLKPTSSSGPVRHLRLPKGKPFVPE